MSKEAFDAVMQSKDAEITNLKEQVKSQQIQILQLTSLLEAQLGSSKS